MFETRTRSLAAEANHTLLSIPLSDARMQRSSHFLWWPTGCGKVLRGKLRRTSRRHLVVIRLAVWSGGCFQSFDSTCMQSSLWRVCDIILSMNIIYRWVDRVSRLVMQCQRNHPGSKVEQSSNEYVIKGTNLDLTEHQRTPFLAQVSRFGCQRLELRAARLVCGMKICWEIALCLRQIIRLYIKTLSFSQNFLRPESSELKVASCTWAFACVIRSPS